jgi:hypothetical protein
MRFEQKIAKDAKVFWWLRRNDRNILKDSGRGIVDPGEPMLKAPPKSHRSIAVQAELDVGGQFANT